MPSAFMAKLFNGDKQAAAAARHNMNFLHDTEFERVVAPRCEPDAFVQRDEILDSRTRISGYRFRPASLDGLKPSVPAKVTALEADNLAAFSLRRMAIVPLNAAEWHGGNYRQFATPNTLFALDVPLPGCDIASWQAALHDIKASGAKVALDSAALSPRLAGALGFADAVIIKLTDYPIDAFGRMVAHLRSSAPNVMVVADDVHTWPEFRACTGVGAHYCVGGFATTADAENAPEPPLSQSRLVLIEMLDMLRGAADLTALAALAKRDPGVAFEILEMANSPLTGLSGTIASIDQAVMLLGRDTLFRWLAMAMFRAGGNSGRDDALLEIALRRARFLELCGKGSLPRKNCDELFVLGLMSLMDKLLAMPMDEVLAKIPLPNCICDVLLSGEGSYARHFMLVRAIERGSAELVARLAQALELDAGAVLQNNSAARVWAGEMAVSRTLQSAR